MSSKTKTITKEVAKPARVPKLRFPEFRGERSRSVILGDVTEEGRSRNKLKHTVSSVMGVTKAEGIVPMEARLIAADIARYKLVQHNWFAYNPMRLNIGSIARWTGKSEILVSPDYVVFKCLDHEDLGIDPVYLDHYRQTNNWSEFVTEGGDGGVRVRIYYRDLARLSLTLPPIAEQQKIAACLTSVDELLAAQARQVESLKAHKKGLMQQLFPREGETQPRLRFPKFLEAGKWVIEPLAKLAEYENGKAYEKDIVENGQYVVVNSRFISTDGAVRKYTNADYLIAKAGEVLMVLSDLPKGRALAKCYFVETNDCYAVNQRVCRLQPKQIDGKFLYYALNRHPRLLAYDDGLNQTHLSKGGVTECPLCIPQEEAEQQRIASCLSSLDALISAATQKLEGLKTHKKGLMQQLFPAPEEVEA
jgi:type I restriction enzyme S subunit